MPNTASTGKLVSSGCTPRIYAYKFLNVTHQYLTISLRRQGDYKPMLIERKAKRIKACESPSVRQLIVLAQISGCLL